MNSEDNCDCSNEPEFSPVRKERKEPTGNDEFTEPKSCGNCIHQNSCGAYWMLKKMVNEMHKEFGGFVKYPMPLTMLAEGCKEYLDKRKIIKPKEIKK